ncbi:MAG: helix-turn-helix domain-containing protein [Ktedonobacteraceae bacterium]
MNDEYYTAKEAMKVLRESKSTFYREVEAGIIPSVGGKRNRKFPKEAIHLHLMRERKKKRGTIRLTFTPSTNSDLWTAIEHEQKTNEESITYRRALEWRDINPDISMSVKDGIKLVGMVTLLPLDENTCKALVEGKMTVKQIPDRAIRKWGDRRLSVYLVGITLILSRNKAVDVERGRFLLRNAIRWAVALTHRYDIASFFALARTPLDQTILENLGFREVAKGKRKGYKLDDWNNPTRLASLPAL